MIAEGSRRFQREIAGHPLTWPQKRILEKATPDDLNRWRENFPWEHWTLTPMNAALLKNKWNTLRARGARIHLELGCGVGWLSNLYAHSAKSAVMIAIDRSHVRLEKAVRLSHALGVQSRSYFFHTNNLPFMVFAVGNEVVDELSVLYPNPHPKNTQRARRFHRGLEWMRAQRILVPGGSLLLTTDQQEYAEDAAATFASSGWETSLVQLEQTHFTELLPRSAFECKFARQKRPLIQIVTQKPSA
jgi:tRNA G46 methylase TrmB